MYYFQLSFSMSYFIRVAATKSGHLISRKSFIDKSKPPKRNSETVIIGITRSLKVRIVELLENSGRCWNRICHDDRWYHRTREKVGFRRKCRMRLWRKIIIIFSFFCAITGVYITCNRWNNTNGFMMWLGPPKRSIGTTQMVKMCQKCNRRVMRERNSSEPVQMEKIEQIKKKLHCSLDNDDKCEYRNMCVMMSSRTD